MTISNISVCLAAHADKVTFSDDLTTELIHQAAGLGDDITGSGLSDATFFPHSFQISDGRDGSSGDVGRLVARHPFVIGVVGVSGVGDDNGLVVGVPGIATHSIAAEVAVGVVGITLAANAAGLVRVSVGVAIVHPGFGLEVAQHVVAIALVVSVGAATARVGVGQPVALVIAVILGLIVDPIKDRTDVADPIVGVVVT